VRSSELDLGDDLDRNAADEAANAAAADLVLTASEEDLRDDIDAELRAGGPSSRPVPAPGCPCGCGETELVQRARLGDDTAVDELLRRYRTLARNKARSYFLVGGDHDDVVQEGMIGVFKAIRDYDPTQGASFRTFADVCVTRQLISAVKSATRLKHGPLSGSVSLDRPVDHEEGTSLGDVLPAAASADPAASVVSAEEVRALQQHFDEVLTDLEQQVLRHHVEGKSYDEIAAMLQRHVKSVDNALQRIKRKLQTHLEDRKTVDV
jgi:RNA polymerase sporulation-specific sigma factor